uniref:Uncharacterized protein n=1 Tax=Aegilops tauschii subsp. strangulata TaxID=200361 RepID=A0A453K5E3_AEGTS
MLIMLQECRVRIGNQPPDRAPCHERVGAVEQTIKEYADKLGDHVVELAIGLTFDSLGEAYDFYSPYSWEHGFSIRYGKSRLNAEKTKCMQEVVYGCSVSSLLSGPVYIWKNHSILCVAEYHSIIDGNGYHRANPF